MQKSNRGADLALMQRQLIAWYHAHRRDLPWRQPGFSAWGSLVSEFMLQQTPVNRVVPHLAEWLERWPTPADLAAAPPGDAVRLWRNLGYPRRALWLHECAVVITERFAGNVPSCVDDLLSLPGVGAYTARAIAVFVFGTHESVVDTNIRRVIARHEKGHSDQGAPRERQDLADMAALLPEDGTSPTFNIAMMELGSLVCTAKNPLCDVCPIAESCAWLAAGQPVTENAGKPRQKRYEGSDRQARGAILKLLREAEHPVTSAEIAGCWPDDVQRGRALDTLLRDGLVVLEMNDLFALPR